MPEQNQTRTTIHLPKAKGKLMTLFKNARTVVAVCEAILNLRIFQKYGDGTNVLPELEAEVDISEGTLTVILPSVSQPGAVNGGGGLSTQQFKVVNEQPDYWNCYIWDGTNLGTVLTAVAKPYKMRAISGPVTETIRGTTYNYTYAQPGGAGTEVVRTTTWGASSETDYCTPPMLVGDVIVAEPFSTTSTTWLPNVKWIYNSVMWAGPTV